MTLGELAVMLKIWNGVIGPFGGVSSICYATACHKVFFSFHRQARRKCKSLGTSFVSVREHVHRLMPEF